MYKTGTIALMALCVLLLSLWNVDAETAGTSDISLRMSMMEDRMSRVEDRLYSLLLSQAPGASASNTNLTLADVMYRLADVTAVLEEIKTPPTCETATTQTTTAPATCYRGMASSVSETFLILDHPDVDNKQVRCDTQTDGGGWIVIQRRVEGNVNFFRDWASYRDGFGTPDGDFWLGNSILHDLTSAADYELRVDVRFDDPQLYFARFSQVKVDSEANKFRLTLGSYSGTVGDQGGSGFAYNNNKDFSTFDRDNDMAVNLNSATNGKAGWWYGVLTATNLNGEWGVQHAGYGMRWYNGQSHRYATFTEMKIRLSV